MKKNEFRMIPRAVIPQSRSFRETERQAATNPRAGTTAHAINPDKSQNDKYILPHRIVSPTYAPTKAQKTPAMGSNRENQFHGMRCGLIVMEPFRRIPSGDFSSPDYIPDGWATASGQLIRESRLHRQRSHSHVMVIDGGYPARVEQHRLGLTGAAGLPWEEARRGPSTLKGLCRTSHRTREQRHRKKSPKMSSGTCRGNATSTSMTAMFEIGRSAERLTGFARQHIGNPG
jgi:hypothetical protein